LFACLNYLQLDAPKIPLAKWGWSEKHIPPLGYSGGWLPAELMPTGSQVLRESQSWIILGRDEGLPGRLEL